MDTYPLANAGVKDARIKGTKRVDGIAYLLVTKNYATYYDIKHRYTIKEILDLYEICLCDIYNQNQILEASKTK